MSTSINSEVIGPKVSKPSDRAWWKSATVYQSMSLDALKVLLTSSVYPASFCDHGSSGHGTLPGILSKIPYLHSLGVDVVWLSPIYTSPQADMGYDISNYRDIDRRYGTLEDWEKVRDAVHQRGMKLVMDLVINHTSEEHAWFKESRSNKTNPKRDWYIWQPAKYNDKGERVPPNNWQSIFGR
jgi:glycosidase